MKKSVLITLLFASLGLVIWPAFVPPPGVDYSVSAEISAYDFTPSGSFAAEHTVTARPVAYHELKVYQTGAPVVDQIGDVAQAFSIPVDTVNSLDEIADKGLFYVKNRPEKGSSWGVWLSYIVGALGFIYGSFLFVRQKYFS
jgi:hypothetical protein